MLNKLYIRIWLAVVLAVAVLTFLVGWAWRMAAEPPLREVVVRNSQGEVIGHGNARRMHPPPPPWGEGHNRPPRRFDERNAGEADEGHERPGHPPPGPPGHRHDEPDDEGRGSFGHGLLVKLRTTRHRGRRELCPGLVAANHETQPCYLNTPPRNCYPALTLPRPCSNLPAVCSTQ